jgi:hypothetical protein
MGWKLVTFSMASAPFASALFCQKRSSAAVQEHKYRFTMRLGAMSILQSKGRVRSSCTARRKASLRGGSFRVFPPAFMRLRIRAVARLTSDPAAQQGALLSCNSHENRTANLALNRRMHGSWFTAVNSTFPPFIGVGPSHGIR